jgi:DNA-binding winged helix-turn-helix (wHTH) protein
MSSLVSHFYKFGDFAVDMDQHVLLRRDKPVPLTPKVFETLLILIERHGRIVAKDELMNRLCPGLWKKPSGMQSLPRWSN